MAGGCGGGRGITEIVEGALGGSPTRLEDSQSGGIQIRSPEIKGVQALGTSFLDSVPPKERNWPLGMSLRVGAAILVDQGIAMPESQDRRQRLIGLPGDIHAQVGGAERGEEILKPTPRLGRDPMPEPRAMKQTVKDLERGQVGGGLNA